MRLYTAYLFLLAISAAFSLALGCAGPSAQVSQIQSEKQELISTVKAQKEEKEALQQRAASLESRLDQSEKEIVRLTGRKSNWDEGTRSASTNSRRRPVGRPAWRRPPPGCRPPSRRPRRPIAPRRTRFTPKP